jgi:hypothetical protein
MYRSKNEPQPKIGNKNLVQENEDLITEIFYTSELSR